MFFCTVILTELSMFCVRLSHFIIKFDWLIDPPAAFRFYTFRRMAECCPANFQKTSLSDSDVLPVRSPLSSVRLSVDVHSTLSAGNVGYINSSKKYIIIINYSGLVCKTLLFYVPGPDCVLSDFGGLQIIYLLTYLLRNIMWTNTAKNRHFDDPILKWRPFSSALPRISA